MLGEELLIKLWETLTKDGIGSLASPWQIKREGKAHAEVRRVEMLMLAQAEVEAEQSKNPRSQNVVLLMPPKRGLKDSLLRRLSELPHT